MQQAHSLIEGIRIQRKVLKGLFSEPMARLAKACATMRMLEDEVELLLIDAFPAFFSCKHLFVLDDQFIQITKNITRDGLDAGHRGRDRRGRPYMVNIVSHTEFKLSEAYISHRQHRPSLTAIQVIRNEQGDLLGFLGADFDMRELPHTEHCYKEPDNWHQMKGDPAIRSGLFYQQRAESIMDDNMDETLENMNELIAEYGVFHGKFHFSSSRATVWHQDDPFTYHLLTVNELTAANIFLAYPKRSYFKRAQVPVDQINAVFNIFKALRFADSNVYLRSGSLNIVNGMVGLNFSCDGSHYMRFDEFLEKDTAFWFGEAGF
jgi:hypothetical protein